MLRTTALIASLALLPASPTIAQTPGADVQSQYFALGLAAIVSESAACGVPIAQEQVMAVALLNVDVENPAFQDTFATELDRRIAMNSSWTPAQATSFCDGAEARARAFLLVQ